MNTNKKNNQKNKTYVKKSTGERKKNSYEDSDTKTIQIINTTNKENYKKLNLLLIMNIITVLLVISLATIMFMPPSNKGSDKQNTTDNKTVLEFEEKSILNENFVFLGDSITDWYPITDFFGDMPIVNSGFAGYKTKDILKNLPEFVYQYNPTKVFILIGTNDLNCDDSNIEIATDNITKIVQEIKKHRPKAEIYVQSIYPVNQTDDEKIKKENTGKRTNEDITRLNANIKKMCQDNKVNYIDMYKELIDKDGNLALQNTVDGLHLSTIGYSKVTKVLLKYIEDYNEE